MKETSPYRLRVFVPMQLQMNHSGDISCTSQCDTLFMNLGPYIYNTV